MVVTAISYLGILLPAGAQPETTPLFSSDATLELTLSANFSEFVKDRDEAASVFRPGIITYVDDNNGRRTLEVNLKTRGRFRLKRGNCSFTQFFIRLEDDELEGTPFAGLDVVPLATHCKKARAYEQYLLQEYLAYQTYNLLTAKSIRTRLARIRYVDASAKRNDVVRLAFFIEHFDSLASRLGSSIVSIDGFSPLDADPYETGLMDVFQYLIGNTDWSTVYQHNVVLLQDPRGRISSVPYDFDWSGVVDAAYAYPGDEVSINSVRQRLYRGVCLPRGTLDRVFAYLVARKSAIYDLYAGQEELEPRLLKRTLKYYDDFYATLGNPKRLQRRIIGACRTIGEQ